MQILTSEQRSKLLEALQNAPDEILLDAVRQVKDYRLNIQDTFKEVQGFCGMKAVDLGRPAFAPTTKIEAPESSVVPQPPVAGAPNPQANQTPPGIACSRIGGETKEKILARCTKASTAEDVNKFLGRGAGKLDDTKSLLKLLWDRGEIVFSNDVYRTKK